MKFIFLGCISLIFLGCLPLQKGDYVTYTSDEYIFLENNFINQKIDCIELGEMKQGGLDAKYCVGVNYASQLVQGFMFEHHYNNPSERFIGASLTFQEKQTFTISCASETVSGATSGKEYISCMVPQTVFDLYVFIMNSKKDIHGTFRGAVGEQKVYNGVIDQEGKARLEKFYKDRATNSKVEWKSRSL